MKVQCDKCKHISENLTLIESRYAKGINQVRVQCPNCKEEVHCYYINQNLKRLQAQLKQAKNVKESDRLREKYRKAFLSFQEQVGRAQPGK